jgi:hypothetical protein
MTHKGLLNSSARLCGIDDTVTLQFHNVLVCFGPQLPEQHEHTGSLFPTQPKQDQNILSSPYTRYTRTPPAR